VRVNHCYLAGERAGRGEVRTGRTERIRQEPSCHGMADSRDRHAKSVLSLGDDGKAVAQGRKGRRRAWEV
jgi:hypothetical protein